MVLLPVASVSVLSLAQLGPSLIISIQWQAWNAILPVRHPNVSCRNEESQTSSNHRDKFMVTLQACIIYAERYLQITSVKNSTLSVQTAWTGFNLIYIPVQAVCKERVELLTELWEVICNKLLFGTVKYVLRKSPFSLMAAPPRESICTSCLVSG